MSKKQDFIGEVQSMMTKLNYEWQSENAKAYWEAFTSVKEEEKPEFTDNGKLILKYMQDNAAQSSFKAKDIGEGLFVSSRVVSGAIRKLVTDGYVEKIGQDPVVYTLTEQGKNKEII
jgi:DNA-binding MarR family transcriptional regulator